MASYNKVIIMGNLTRDPEVRYTQKGTAVCDISLAINRKFKADSGEQREEVTFVDVVLWAKTAELAGQYLAKGRPVHIEGRLETQSWDDKATGQKRSKLRVVGENMQFIGSKPEGAAAASHSSPAERKQPAPDASPAGDVFGDGDDIPF